MHGSFLKGLLLKLKSYMKFIWLQKKNKNILDRPCEFPPGVPTVIGFMTAPTGLGYGARLIYNALKNEGYNPNCIDISEFFYSGGGLSRDFSSKDKIDDGPLIFHVNAPELLYVIEKLGAQNIQRQKIIAIWAWEQPILPKLWTKVDNYVDEIWASSHFLKDVFDNTLRSPIFYTPYPVASFLISKELPLSKRPRKFRVLTAFDPNSGIERKNPHGAIKAFQNCFNEDDSVELTIKVSDPNWPIPENWKGIKNVNIENTIVSDTKMEIYMRDFDCVISLHRSEGFGFLMATALCQGIPTIFTEGSGSGDFSTCPGAYTVSGNPYTIQKEDDQYQRKHGQWLDPEIDKAEAFLIEIFNMPQSQREEIALAARTWWEAHFSTANFMSGIPAQTLNLFQRAK